MTTATASRPMLLKARVMDPGRRDDISEVLADVTAVGELRTVPVYMVNYYPDGLKAVTLGPNSKNLVGVSRYYPRLDPKVVVDFEPAPPDPWFHDEKARFFLERGILYLPIALQDKLTEAEFATRYQEAKMRLDRGLVDQRDTARETAAVEVEDILQDPKLQEALDARARWEAEQELMQRNKPRPRGAALTAIVARHKRALLGEVRRKLKVNADGSLDLERCCRELTDPIERRFDGQVRPPEPGGSGA